MNVKMSLMCCPILHSGIRHHKNSKKIPGKIFYRSSFFSKIFFIVVFLFLLCFQYIFGYWISIRSPVTM